jgi:dTDP-4-dehydrorhamnose reductase
MNAGAILSKIQDIAATVTALASPGMKPKDLIAAVREKHPDVGKKAIVRAAFYAAIEQAETDPPAAVMLHGAAMDARKEEGGDEPKADRDRKKKRS